jgi:hypothetical protein
MYTITLDTILAWNIFRSYGRRLTRNGQRLQIGCDMAAASYL